MTPVPTRPLFAALLTPHRSLSRVGIRRVVLLFAGLALVPGIYFYLLGAWPVVGFLGLDALALWWALSRSHRAGTAFEEITLWPDALKVRHVSARGRERQHRFNPFWVRLQIDRDPDAQVMRIALNDRTPPMAHRPPLEIGTFLNPDDKSSFAQAFSQALVDARR